MSMNSTDWQNPAILCSSGSRSKFVENEFDVVVLVIVDAEANC